MSLGWGDGDRRDDITYFEFSEAMNTKNREIKKLKTINDFFRKYENLFRFSVEEKSTTQAVYAECLEEWPDDN